MSKKENIGKDRPLQHAIITKPEANEISDSSTGNCNRFGSSSIISNSSNPIKYMNTNDIFDSSKGRNGQLSGSVTSTKKSTDTFKTPVRNGSAEIIVDNERYSPLGLKKASNQRTPDLEKIANFFKNKRTPRRNKILETSEYSDSDDTPISQRMVIYEDLSPSKASTAKKNLLNDVTAIEDTTETVIDDSRLSTGLKEIVLPIGEPFLNNSSPFRDGTANPYHASQLGAEEVSHIGSHRSDNNNENSNNGKTTAVDEHSQYNTISDGRFIFRISDKNEANSAAATQRIQGSQNETQSTELIDNTTQHDTSLIKENGVTSNSQNSLDSKTPEVYKTGYESGMSSQSVIDVTTPLNSVLLSHDNVIEVPRTSSPSKLKVPRTKITSSQNDQHLDTQYSSYNQKVYLQVISAANKDYEQTYGDTQLIEDKESHIISDGEQTQELPEIEEEAELDDSISQHHSTRNFSQDISSKTEQIRATANILATSSEDDANDHESPCNKRAKISEKEGLAKPDKINSNNLYKQEWIKKLKLQNDNVQNLGTLEPKDIIFEDAVWYQYDANLKFYPGRIESIDYIRNKAQIRHKTGTVEVNIGDVYYLNLLIGDHVDCGGYTGEIIALKCLSENSKDFRCVRGFDHVLLKRLSGNGKLGLEVFEMPISDICMSIEQWMKRSKIHVVSHPPSLEPGNDLSTPSRSGKRSSRTSPRKNNKNAIYIESSTPAKLKSETAKEDQRSSPIVPINISFNTSMPECTINDDYDNYNEALFVFSSLADNSTELTERIEQLGGLVLEEGFSSVFEYCAQNRFDDTIIREKYGITVKNIQPELIPKDDSPIFTRSFACVVSRRHLRSLKYLECLALGWPTIHWKFIEDVGSISHASINQLWNYLLPSGESLRLAEADQRLGVIISNNIFEFTRNYLKGYSLNQQCSNRSNILRDYTIIVLGSSQLDNFLNFAFSCLGAAHVSYIFPSSISDYSDLLKNTLSKKQRLVVIENIFRLLGELRDYEGINVTDNIILFVNCNSNEKDDKLVDMLRRNQKREAIPDYLSINIESKEWLIQTIINGSNGFSRVVG